MKQTLFVAALLFVGCGSMQEVLERRAHGEGTTEIHAISTKQAWKHSITILQWYDAGAMELHPDSGYILTGIGDRPFYGRGPLTHAGVWIESADSGRSRVTIVLTNIAAGLTEPRFHTLLSYIVGLEKAGKKIPMTKPFSTWPRDFR